MRRRLRILQIVFGVLFLLTFIAAIIQVLNLNDPVAKRGNEIPGNGRAEQFDPSLSRLNTVDLLMLYCDSVYEQQFTGKDPANYVRDYALILSSVTRNRFYHGYSYYGLRTNYVASIFAKLTYDGYRAIVIPNDILKYPMAACSQQSIIMMEILKKRRITFRKIGFRGEVSGHFSFEAYYNKSWHFFDPDMEPDATLLNSHNRPDIATLAGNKELLLSAYKDYSPDLVLDVFPSYFYGPVNTFPAPRGLIFQWVSLVLSYSLWLVFLIAFIFVRRKYRRISKSHYVRNNRVSFPQTQEDRSAEFNRGITAPGA